MSIRSTQHNHSSKTINTATTTRSMSPMNRGVRVGVASTTDEPKKHPRHNNMTYYLLPSSAESCRAVKCGKGGAAERRGIVRHSGPRGARLANSETNAVWRPVRKISPKFRLLLAYEASLRKKLRCFKSVEQSSLLRHLEVSMAYARSCSKLLLGLCGRFLVRPGISQGLHQKAIAFAYGRRQCVCTCVCASHVSMWV